MNLIILLLGFRVWVGPPVEIVTRVFCAVSLLSLEMQLATWTALATLRTLVPFNIVVAALLCLRGRLAAASAAAAGPKGPALQPDGSAGSAAQASPTGPALQRDGSAALPAQASPTGPALQRDGSAALPAQAGP